MVELGVDVRLYTLAATTPPTSMRLLTRDEQRDLKVIFDPDAIGPWVLEAYRTGLTATASAVDGSMIITLGCSRQLGGRFALLKYRGLQASDARGLTVVTLFGLVVRAEGIQVLDQKDGIGILVRIPDTFDPGKAEAAREMIFGVSESLPRPKWAVFGRELPSENFGSVARLAFRNCY